MTEDRIDRVERCILVLWFLANICIGLFFLRDFGMSYDEPNYYVYARDTVDAYKSFFALAYTPVFGPSDLPDYGPAFIIFPELAIRIVKLAFPSIFDANVWHFSYFLFFQLSGLCLFSLARRWFNRWSAWGVLLLYTFQPVLWGHAFMNPKDTPFMCFFTFTIWSGLRFTDSLGVQAPDISLRSTMETVWSPIHVDNKNWLIRFFKIEAYAILIIAAVKVPLDFLAEKLILLLYAVQPYSSLGKWFHSIAPQAINTPAGRYVAKAQMLLIRAEYGILLVGLMLIIAYFAWALSKSKKQTSQTRATSYPVKQKLSDVCREFLALIRSPTLILAGILLGMTISIRILGPLAGLIVILYLVFTLGQKSFPAILAYLIYASLAMFLTWPYLWPSPIGHLMESLLIMANFPWVGRVLFDGRLYEPDKIPFTYIPTLLNIQLTETLLFLIYFGFLVLISMLLRKRIKLDLLIVLLVGAILPLTGLIATSATLYDNFRQILFIVALLILLAGLALDTIFSAIKPTLLRLALIIVFVFPGVYANIKLHPYEYIYYNTLIGGLPGAQDNFELDYWRTSFGEMTLALNEVASPNPKVVVGGFYRTIVPYARPDFFIEPAGVNPERLNGGYDYAILSTRYHADRMYPDAKIIFSVERDGVTLGVVKAVKGLKTK